MCNVFKENEDKFIKYMKTHKDVLAVFLFGSYCDGTYNENSDIDIAVLYNKNKEFLDHSAMAIDIEKIFNNTKIDYINLEDINVFFKFKILKNGKLIYTKDEDRLYKYMHNVQNQYIEMSYSRKKYVDYVLNHDSLKGDE